MEEVLVKGQGNHCHLASPRRRERIFPWQVFGLCRLWSSRRTSQTRARPVSSKAFVPAYRCGAVPDSHRIPYSLSVERPRNSSTICWVVRRSKHQWLWKFSRDS